jgi:hypothetical protein
VNLLDEFLLLFRLEAVVPLGQAGLAGAVLNQDELDRHDDQNLSQFDSLNSECYCLDFDQSKRVDRFLLLVENLGIHHSTDSTGQEIENPF